MAETRDAIIQRQTRNAGRVEVETNLDGLKDCSFGIDAVAWDDPSLVVQISIGHFDGKEWRHQRAVTIVGGSSGKGGGRPSIAVPSPSGDYRVSLTLSKRAAVGIEATRTT